MGYEFYVNEDVLIPRQDTETLVEDSTGRLSEGQARSRRVLDMCTGSGCILTQYSAGSSGWHHGTGADLSEKALKVAACNARRLSDSRQGRVCKK